MAVSPMSFIESMASPWHLVCVLISVLTYLFRADENFFAVRGVGLDYARFDNIKAEYTAPWYDLVRTDAKQPSLSAVIADSYRGVCTS
jgi:hypothetical protein